MKKLTNILRKTGLVALILLPIAALAHYIIFPQETRSILIDYSHFKKENRIYYSTGTSAKTIDSLQSFIQQASERVHHFWGQKTSNPKFIYCSNAADFANYCNNPSAPAVTYLKLGSYIVLSTDGMDLDIIAHEISHAELYEQTGFYLFNFSIPSWFKHGLAMQNDYRNYYSEDTLKARTNNFLHMPDIKNLTTDAQFYAGTLQQVMLNYMAAKHEIKNWYTPEKLRRCIQALDAVKSFKEAYNQ